MNQLVRNPHRGKVAKGWKLKPCMLMCEVAVSDSVDGFHSYGWAYWESVPR